MAKKVCVVFGNGFEDIEFVTPIDILRRGGVNVVTASADKKKEVVSAHEIKIIAETDISQIQVDEFHALILPGGPSSFKLKDEDEVLKLIKLFHLKNKLICAICAAPLILHNAGILGGKKFCSHPCTYDVLVDADRTARLVISENLITAKGPGVAAEFGLAILHQLCGREISETIKTEMFL